MTRYIRSWIFLIVASVTVDLSAQELTSLGTIPARSSSGPSAESTIIVKSADESVADNTIQDDDHFTISVAANETWVAEAYLFVTGSTTGDMQWSWSAPTGATGWNSGNRLIAGATLTSADVQTSAIEDLTDTGFRTAGLAGTSAPVLVWVRAVLANGSTAGSWQFRWAQNVTDAGNPTVVQSGSHIVFRRQ